MTGLVTKLNTYWHLKPYNLFLAVIYRLQIKTGWFKIALPVGNSINGTFYSGEYFQKEIAFPTDAKLLLEGKVRFFSKKLVEVLNPPNWFCYNQLQNSKLRFGHWSQINDFDNGDIKLVWELSRFHWLVLAGQGYATTRDKSYLKLINYWLNDWSAKNPINKGANWKCGQEASFRVLNLTLTSFILDTFNNPLMPLVEMIKQHCRRIYSTLHYATAQDNNHATSEAAALFIAGIWFDYISCSNLETIKWEHKGRFKLERLINRLVLNDGTFSQYSVNYHRLFLDAVSLAEFFRNYCGKHRFSDKFYKKINLAIDWICQITDPKTGAVPNLGANDGTQLLQLVGKDYRDFRPSSQLAYALFKNKLIYGDDSNGILEWLRISINNMPLVNENKKSKVFCDGGYVSFIADECQGILRFPKFKFRPSQADMLHVDIMNNGKPIICDGGSYSYNNSKKWLNYFSGIESHNTVQFDNSEPMPKISRFLFGSWPKVRSLAFETKANYTFWSGGYKDYLGRQHYRTVIQEPRVWNIRDDISGFLDFAVLRWRLCNSNWRIIGNKVFSDEAEISVHIDKNDVSKLNLVEGWESLYYNEKTKISVLEMTMEKSCVVNTIISL